MTATEFIFSYMKADEEAKKCIERILAEVKPRELSVYEQLDLMCLESGLEMALRWNSGLRGILNA